MYTASPAQTTVQNNFQHRNVAVIEFYTIRCRQKTRIENLTQ